MCGIKPNVVSGQIIFYTVVFSDVIFPSCRFLLSTYIKNTQYFFIFIVTCLFFGGSVTTCSI